MSKVYYFRWPWLATENTSAAACGSRVGHYWSSLSVNSPVVLELGLGLVSKGEKR